MGKLKSFVEKQKRTMAEVTVAASAGATKLVAQSGTIAELESQAQKVLDLFSGRIIAIIMCIALMIVFAVVAWGNSQGEGGSTIKKVTPWIIGIIGIGSAAGITRYFLGISVR